MPIDSPDTLVNVWRKSDDVTTFLLENLPDEIYPEKVPRSPRRNIRMIAGHIHNSRCMWIEMIGERHGITGERKIRKRGTA
jgi:hypothetical protein